MIKEQPYDMLNQRSEDTPAIGEGVDWTLKARLQFQTEPRELEDITFDALDVTDPEQSSTIHQFLYDAFHKVVTTENYQDHMDRVIASTRMTDDEIHQYIARLIRGHMFDDELVTMDSGVREKLTKALHFAS